MPAKRRRPVKAVKPPAARSTRASRAGSRIEKLDPAMQVRAVSEEAKASLKWYPYTDDHFTVEGLGWYAEDGRALRRLPGRAKDLVRPPVWDLAQHTSGARIRFRTDSSALTLRIRQPYVEMRNMAPIGHSGIDLHVGEPGNQVYWNVTRPDFDAQRTLKFYDAPLFEAAGHQLRECTLYLPVYNAVLGLEIGLDASATILPPTPYRHSRPIVFYGTSITQSGCASRPSNGFVPILGRILNSDVINLGFSGNGLGEPEMAALVSEIDASIFVLDYEANAGLERMRENLLPFCEAIRQRHPATPLVLVTKLAFPKVHRLPGGAEGRRQAMELCHSVADQINGKYPGLTLVVDGWSLIPPNSPYAFIDESHPTDAGFLQIAERLAPVLHACLPLG